MTQNLNQEFVHLELGDYLELLQNTILVGGKRLNDKEICHDWRTAETRVYRQHRMDTFLS